MPNKIDFPKMVEVRQTYPPSPQLDFSSLLDEQFNETGVLKKITPGMRIAVGVGSRGIANLLEIVKATLDVLIAAGARPFVDLVDVDDGVPLHLSPLGGQLQDPAQRPQIAVHGDRAVLRDILAIPATESPFTAFRTAVQPENANARSSKAATGSSMARPQASAHMPRRCHHPYR